MNFWIILFIWVLSGSIALVYSRLIIGKELFREITPTISSDPWDILDPTEVIVFHLFFGPMALVFTITLTPFFLWLRFNRKK